MSDLDGSALDSLGNGGANLWPSVVRNPRIIMIIVMYFLTRDSSPYFAADSFATAAF